MYINNTESTLRRNLIRKTELAFLCLKKNKTFTTDLITSFILLLSNIQDKAHMSCSCSFNFKIKRALCFSLKLKKL